MISSKEILLAHNRIVSYIHRTPVLTSELLNEISGCKLFFKCENFQKIGAFKIRGAMNAALSLTAEKINNGLATHSSGNHAQAIAYAAKNLNTKAFIVMPENSPLVKVNAVRGYGAVITFCTPTQQAREDTMNEIIEKTRAYFIHPYDNSLIIAGQSTCAKELLEDTGNLDAIITPVGGGGLLSGTIASAYHISPGTKIYAGEPEGAADVELSLKTGKIQKAIFIKTIADGLLTSLGKLNFEIIRKNLSGVITVSDKEIVSAMKLIYQYLKIVVEPSAAVPFAALLRNKKSFQNNRVGIILSGGNIDISYLDSLLAKTD